MNVVRVMRRPRPTRVRKVEEVAETYERCSGCVSRKMCDAQTKCLHGTKAKPKGKKNARANGRVSAK
jgi:hypothetical protein